MRYLVVSGTQRSFQAIWRICLKMCKFGLVHSCWSDGKLPVYVKHHTHNTFFALIKAF